MEPKVPDRDQALQLLHRYNESESLRKHAYAIEKMIQYITKKRNKDKEK